MAKAESSPHGINGHMPVNKMSLQVRVHLLKRAPPDLVAQNTVYEWIPLWTAIQREIATPMTPSGQGTDGDDEFWLISELEFSKL